MSWDATNSSARTIQTRLYYPNSWKAKNLIDSTTLGSRFLPLWVHPLCHFRFIAISRVGEIIRENDTFGRKHLRPSNIFYSIILRLYYRFSISTLTHRPFSTHPQNYWLDHCSSCILCSLLIYISFVHQRMPWVSFLIFDQDSLSIQVSFDVGVMVSRRSWTMCLSMHQSSNSRKQTTR